MVFINSPNPSMRTQPVSPAVDNTPQAIPHVTLAKSADQPDARPASASSSVSTLALQLSAAATRAQSRDATLGPQALSQRAEQVLDTLSGGALKDDPADGAGRNPFRGLPRDQLALITYDEGGKFSVRERLYAKQEASSQELAWRRGATQDALAEYSSSGKMTGFFTEALVHFKSLPLIEQAQYSQGYAADLQQKIDLGPLFKSPAIGESVFSPLETIRAVLPDATAVRQLPVNEPPNAIGAPQADMPVAKTASTDNGGRQVMLSRLFDGHEPAVISGVHGMSFTNMDRSVYAFLTQQDRTLFSDIYAYAQQQDIDLTRIDLIASRLGEYRKCNDGRLMGSYNGGRCYNSQGWQRTVSFTEKDAATASRLLNSAAINSTRFDQGFLRFILDPGFGAMSNTGNMEVIEHLVTRFSAEADTTQPLDIRFSTYVPLKRGEGHVMHTSTTIRRQVIEPEVISENGVSRLSEKGRPRGITLDGGAGANPVSSLMQRIGTEAGLDVLREWHQDERKAEEQGWLGRLWKHFQHK